MGEAKKRALAYAQAKRELTSSVDAEALIVANAAITLFERFIHPTRYSGGCYLTTMTLHRFLDKEHGISTKPVIGYVNDGTDDIMISHAWLEYENQKVDLTLHVTDGHLTGALIVLDRVLRPGQIAYSYHKELTAEGLAEEEVMRRDPQLAPVVRHKRAEHKLMSEIARTPDLMSQYLASAPREMNYETMTGRLRAETGGR